MNVDAPYEHIYPLWYRYTRSPIDSPVERLPQNGSFVKPPRIYMDTIKCLSASSTSQWHYILLARSLHCPAHIDVNSCLTPFQPQTLSCATSPTLAGKHPIIVPRIQPRAQDSWKVARQMVIGYPWSREPGLSLAIMDIPSTSATDASLAQLEQWLQYFRVDMWILHPANWWKSC